MLEEPNCLITVYIPEHLNTPSSEIAEQPWRQISRRIDRSSAIKRKTSRQAEH